MLVALTVVGLVLAVLIGVGLRYATSKGSDKAEGADVVKVLGSTSLIAGLLVGFVLAGRELVLHDGAQRGEGGGRHRRHAV